MNAGEIVEELKGLGSATYKATLLRHGIREPAFGVKIEYLKKIQKRIKKDYQLALDLYETGVYDAMYLAGLVADDSRMTAKDLGRWVEKASSPMLSEYTIAWVAAGSPHGRRLALEWIESKKVNIAAAGWSTLASWVGITDDAQLDLDELERLLKRVEKSIHDQPNRVRYVMNGFVIAVGTYVARLTETAIETAKRMGEVSVDMGATACQVPYAPDHINKARKRGVIGKKRKTAQC